MGMNARYSLNGASVDRHVSYTLLKSQGQDVQPSRHPELMEKLGSETGTLESIVGES